MHAASRSVRGPNHTTDCQWVRTLPLQEADLGFPGVSLVEDKNLVNRGGAQLLVDPRDAPALAYAQRDLSCTSRVLALEAHDSFPVDLIEQAACVSIRAWSFRCLIFMMASPRLRKLHRMLVLVFPFPAGPAALCDPLPVWPVVFF